MFKFWGFVLGGSLLVIAATVIPGGLIGLPALGGFCVLTAQGGIGGAVVGGTVGAIAGRTIDIEMKGLRTQLREVAAQLVLYTAPAAAWIDYATILAAAASCDGKVNQFEEAAIKSILGGEKGPAFLARPVRTALKSLLERPVTRAEAIEAYRRLERYQLRGVLEDIDYLLYADTDAESADPAYLHADELAFRSYWLEFAGTTTQSAPESSIA